MPSVAITTDGATPKIATSTTRTGLVLENHSAVDFRIRFAGPVALVEGTQKGLKLAKNGGCKALSGTHARTAVYAIHETTPAGPVYLDYEEMTL